MKHIAQAAPTDIICRVESEPVESSQSLLDGFPSSNDETESQIFDKAHTRPRKPIRIAGRLRDVVSAADHSTASEFAGKRHIRAFPLPESTVRLSIGRSVLEEVLLLQQCPKGRLG